MLLPPKNQSGNALITLIVAIIIATIIYFLLVPEAKRKIKSNEQKLPSALASKLGEATNRPLPVNHDQSYNGVLSWTNKDDITINPFDNPEKNQIPNQTSNILPLEKQNPTPKLVENLITQTPLGLPFPKKSGYLDGYPIAYAKGTLKTVIDNKIGDSDLMVILNYHGKINKTVTSESKIARGLFVKKGESFNIESLDSGAYSMIWVRLKDGAQAPTQPFLLYKDVKFEYNRIIKFH